MNNYEKRFSGRLLLKEELNLSESELTHLLDTNQLIGTESIIKHSFTYQCLRCNNTEAHQFGKIPCSNCQKTHLYCRNCIQMGRVMTCTPLYRWVGKDPVWPLSTEDPLEWGGELTIAQKEASDELIKAIKTNQKELLIHAVCGAGKTEMLFEGMAFAIRAGKRICLTSPRADVIRELLPRFQQAFPSVSIIGLYGGSGQNEKTAQLTLATTHQLLRYENAFDLIIIDEIDAFPYHADPSLPYATKRARKHESTFVYLSATPRQDLLKQRPPTVFVPVRYHGHPLPVPKLLSTFKFEPKKLPACFWKWVETRQNKQRQVLIFTPTIKQTAEKLLILEKAYANKVIASVHAEDADRIEKVNQFRKKRIDILITTTILERGVTFPSVDVIVLDAGHQVFDQAALIQIAGRAGRSPDDPTGEVVFIHDGKTRNMNGSIRAIENMNKRAGFN